MNGIALLSSFALSGALWVLIGLMLWLVNPVLGVHVTAFGGAMCIGFSITIAVALVVRYLR